jgi:hypothetical protein
MVDEELNEVEKSGWLTAKGSWYGGSPLSSMLILVSQNSRCCGYIGAVAGPKGEFENISGEN